MKTSAKSVLRMPHLLAVTACVAACSIAYELIVAKMIAELAGNPPLWESLTIGTYILSLGLGALCFGRFKDRDPIRILTVVELLLTLGGALSGFVVLALHIEYRIDFYDDGQLRALLDYPPVIWFAIPAQLVAAAVGFLSGFELPALMRAAATVQPERSEVKILIAYYGGTLLGTVAFGVAHAFNISDLSAALGTAAINFVVALALVTVMLRGRRWVQWSALAALAGVLGALSLSVDAFTQLHMKNFYYNKHTWRTEGIGVIKEFFPLPLSEFVLFAGPLPRIERYRTKYQVIDIVTNASLFDPDAPKDGFALYINGRFQLSKASHRDYHDNLGVKPAAISGVHAKHVLILGGGDGILAAAMLAGPTPPSGITLVDIDPEMLYLAQSDPRLLALNRGALTSAEVHVVVDDAFNFLRYGDQQFDAVFFDVTFPFDLDSARFSTVEIFNMVRRRLTPQGYVAAPLPFNPDSAIGERLSGLVTHTLGRAGFRHLITYSGAADSFLVTTLWQMRSISGEDASMAEFQLTGDGTEVHSLIKPARFHVPDPFF